MIPRWIVEQLAIVEQLRRAGGMTVSLPMSCGHREAFNADDPGLLAQVGALCTTCLLFVALEEAA